MKYLLTLLTIPKGLNYEMPLRVSILQNGEAKWSESFETLSGLDKLILFKVSIFNSDTAKNVIKYALVSESCFVNLTCRALAI